MLPGPDRPVEELQSALARLAPRFGVDAAVFSEAGERLAWAGAPLPLPRAAGRGGSGSGCTGGSCSRCACPTAGGWWPRARVRTGATSVGW